MFITLAILMSACSDPVKDFRAEIVKVGRDKQVTEKELSTLDQLLEKAVKKNKGSVNIGTREIQNHDDLVAYLRDQRGWAIKEDAPVATVSFDTFRIAMELSASMKGYFGTGNPDFCEPVIALLNSGDRETRFVTSYVGLSSVHNPVVVHREVDKDTFVESITRGVFTPGTGSPLDRILADGIRMISEAAAEKETGDVFCLVTDGLLSGSDAEIRQNPRFNENNLPVLEDRIRQAVKPAREKGIECLVYRITTPFKGTYYDCRNGRHAFNAIRPYFLILFGAERNLRHIESVLATETNFTNHPSYRFASYDMSSFKSITRADLRPIPRQNASIRGKTVVYDRRQLSEQPVVFSIQLKLNSLPEYYLASLEEDLILAYVDKTSGTEVVIPNAEWISDLSGDPATKVYKLTASLPEESLRRMAQDGSLHLWLPGRQDDWYRTFSTDCDVDIVDGDVNSFGLSYLMGGVMKAYGYQDQATIPDAISYEFNVKYQ